jgi:hypothetical protein
MLVKQCMKCKRSYAMAFNDSSVKFMHLKIVITLTKNITSEAMIKYHEPCGVRESGKPKLRVNSHVLKHYEYIQISG